MQHSDPNLKTAMNTAIRLLTRRNHATAELRKKLMQRGFTSDIISAVIAECERLHYLDDEECTRLYFRELRNRGYGAQRIRRDMKNKGLWSQSAEEILLAYAESSEEKETARKVFEKKKAGLEREKDQRKRKEKIFRFLYARGFSGRIIAELIRQEAV